VSLPNKRSRVCLRINDTVMNGRLWSDIMGFVGVVSDISFSFLSLCSRSLQCSFFTLHSKLLSSKVIIHTGGNRRRINPNFTTIASSTSSSQVHPCHPPRHGYKADVLAAFFARAINTCRYRFGFGPECRNTRRYSLRGFGPNGDVC
jgi:hypothetical protein